MKPDEQRKREIISALREAKGDREKAAEKLGIHRVTLWRQMKELGLVLEEILAPQPLYATPPPEFQKQPGTCECGRANCRGNHRANPASFGLGPKPKWGKLAMSYAPRKAPWER